MDGPPCEYRTYFSEIETFHLDDPLKFSGNLSEHFISSRTLRMYIPRYRYARVLAWKIFEASIRLGLVTKTHLRNIQYFMSKLKEANTCTCCEGEGPLYPLEESLLEEMWPYLKVFGLKLAKLKWSDPTYVLLADSEGKLKKEIGDYLISIGINSYGTEVQVGVPQYVAGEFTQEEFLSRLPEELRNVQWDFEQAAPLEFVYD